ncbi:hypothetical protein L1887_41772 [Cichorium endivia]|nr:hypothetical protein L1887_41772 [Cichorium endivia]
MYFFTNSLRLQLPTVTSGYFSGHRHALQVFPKVIFQQELRSFCGLKAGMKQMFQGLLHGSWPQDEGRGL